MGTSAIKLEIAAAAPRTLKAPASTAIISRTASQAAPYVLGITRIVAAFLFIQAGTVKLFAFPAAIMPGGGTAPLLSLVGIAGILEFVGGLFILAGFCTRSVAFVLAGEMAFAYFLGHAGTSFWTVLNHGEAAVLFCFLWLYIAAAGPGKLSLDSLRSR